MLSQKWRSCSFASDPWGISFHFLQCFLSSLSSLPQGWKKNFQKGSGDRRDEITINVTNILPFFHNECDFACDPFWIYVNIHEVYFRQKKIIC